MVCFNKSLKGEQEIRMYNYVTDSVKLHNTLMVLMK